MESYKKVIISLNKRLKEVIQTILLNSAKPPIIILQSDRNPGSYLEWSRPEQINLRERMANFTACYFPDQNYGKCYPQITPVNIFRIVLNQFFKLNLVALDDEVFFRTSDIRINLST